MLARAKKQEAHVLRIPNHESDTKLPERELTVGDIGISIQIYPLCWGGGVDFLNSDSLRELSWGARGGCLPWTH